MCWDKILTIKRVLDSKGLFLQASKLMESRDEKAANVKSSDADADDDDEKTMDDSPTSNDDDADESTSTTQSAATKSTGNSFS